MVRASNGRERIVPYFAQSFPYPGEPTDTVSFQAFSQLPSLETAPREVPEGTHPLFGALADLDTKARKDPPEVTGQDYVALAIIAAKQEEPDFALALALDVSRISVDEEMPKDNTDHQHKASIAGTWLSRTSDIYRAVRAPKKAPTALEAVYELDVEHYVSVLEQTPVSIKEIDDAVCAYQNFKRAGAQVELTERLLNIDPRVRTAAIREQRRNSHVFVRAAGQQTAAHIKLAVKH
jgi:hypothetical protein